MKKLTKQQARFVAEYVAAPNCKRAATNAGYSAHSANGTGSKLLRKAHVAAAIAQGTAQVFERLEIKAEDLLREVARVIFADLSGLFGEDGQPKDLGEIDAETLALLDVTLTYDKDGRHTGTRLRRLDKMAAIALLGKYLKLFTDKVEVVNGREIAAAIAEAREQAP